LFLNGLQGDRINNLLKERKIFMSTISSATQSGQPSQSIGSTYKPYVIPPTAAGIIIPFIFYGFIAKSAQQLGQPIPVMSIKHVFKEGCKAAPTIGLIVGTQMGAQATIEKVLSSLMKKSDKQKEKTANFALMLISSILVGAVSAPALDVFNNQTRGKTVRESLKALSVKQTCAIIARETSFLFSLRASEPIGAQMKQTLGENRVIEYGSAFATGAIGSFVGHPFDTALTLWQNGMKVKNLRQMMRGAPIKALTVGSFSIGYKTAKEFLERNIS
jgi:hypothetical protein